MVFSHRQRDPLERGPPIFPRATRLFQSARQSIRLIGCAARGFRVSSSSSLIFGRKVTRADMVLQRRACSFPTTQLSDRSFADCSRYSSFLAVHRRAESRERKPIKSFCPIPLPLDAVSPRECPRFSDGTRVRFSAYDTHCAAIRRQ